MDVLLNDTGRLIFKYLRSFCVLLLEDWNFSECINERRMTESQSDWDSDK